MKSKKKSYTLSVVSIIEFIILILPLVFEYLSKKKPLVMRHIYTRKIEHLSTILDASHRYIYASIIGLIALVLLYLLFKKANLKIKNLVFPWLLSILLVLMLAFDAFSSKITYSYSILLLLLVFLFEIVKLIIIINFTKNNKKFY